MRSASSPPTVGSTTISNSVVITSMPVSIARLAMPRSARGTMLPKLRLQRDPSPAGFAHHASATGNLTMPPGQPGRQLRPVPERRTRCDHRLVGDNAALNERADELVAVATEQGFPFWRAHGTICRGWVKVKNSDVAEGISLLRTGSTPLRAKEA